MKKESARDTERIKERAAFLWVALQIDSVRVQPVFAGKQDTGNTGTRPKVVDADAAGDRRIAKQLFGSRRESWRKNPFGRAAHRRITSPSYAVSSMSASSKLDMMVRSTTSLSSSSDLGSAAAAPPACSYAILASEK